MVTLILGSRGYVGRYFRQTYPDAHTDEVDITRRNEIAVTLGRINPDVVINCAGKTGRPNVDWCEENKLETIAANVTGPLLLLEECLKRSIYLVHISSGCIYSNDAGNLWQQQYGFSEDDKPNFAGSFYSRSKAMIDQAMQDFPVLNLRLRMPFDGTNDPRNLITKLKAYKRVLTEPNSMTYMPQFMSAAKQLIANRTPGTFNIVNRGVISPFEIMKRYKELVDPTHEFEPLALKDMGEVARAGRSNCRLSPDKILALGIQMSTIDLAIGKALTDLPKVK